MFSAEHEKHWSLPELKGTKGDNAGDGAVGTLHPPRIRHTPPGESFEGQEWENLSAASFG